MNLSFQVIINDNDIKDTSEIAEKIWKEYYTQLLGSNQITYMLNKFQSEKAIKEQINNGTIYKIVLFDNKIAGYYAIKKETNKIFISKVYIDKEFRGNGIFKAIIEDITKHFYDIKSLYLTVNKYNTDAISAYKKMNFNKVDSIESDIGSGYFMDDYIMEKVLYKK